MALAEPQRLRVQFYADGPDGKPMANPVAAWHEYPAGTYVKPLSPDEYRAAQAAMRATRSAK